MLLSLALIFSLGLVLSELFSRAKLPGFIGMIIAGAILGPFALDLIDDTVLNISSELRQVALIVILLRAGLNLDLEDLKKIGRPAIFMAFLPATFEIIAVVIFAPMLFDISYIEAGLLATILAAVSPAVVVPKMISLMDKGYGHKKRIPHLVMASASVDDIYVIVLFTILVRMYQTNELNFMGIINVPIAIILGIIVGGIVGYLLAKIFAIVRVRDTIKVLLVLATAFFIVTLEGWIEDIVPMSGLLAVMVMGISFLQFAPIRAKRLRINFSKIWVFTELILFVLVGAAVDLSLALSAGLVALLLLLIELIFRMSGVGLALLGTNLNKKERLFTGISYIPKATVQAAIGAIPLSLGVPHGDLILAIAVLSIIVTAPLGAIGIESTKDSLLTIENPQS